MTDDTTTPVTVWITTGWMSEEPPSSRGRVIIIRSIEASLVDEDGEGDDDHGGPIVEVWASAPQDELSVIEAGRWVADETWRDLVLGRRLIRIKGRVDLREAKDKLIDRVLNVLVRGANETDSSRILTELQLVVRARDSVELIHSGVLERMPQDILSSLMSPAMREAADVGHRNWTTSVKIRNPGPTKETSRDQSAIRPRSAAAHIRIRNSRGIQVGEHNTQVNCFIASIPANQVDFEAVLQRQQVRNALTKLQADPGSSQKRASLEGVLGDRPAIWSPTRIKLGRQRRGLADFLRSMVLVDVRDVQIGDHNRQANTFTYLIPATPSGADLLRSHPALVRALADYLCPRPGSGPNVLRLQDRLSASLRRVPIDWSSGDRTLGLARTIAPSEAFKISRVDGASVGSQNEQTNKFGVELIDLGGAAR